MLRSQGPSAGKRNRGRPAVPVGSMQTRRRWSTSASTGSPSLPTLLALVVLMFSLEGAPEPIEPATPPATSTASAPRARRARSSPLAPEREPGSAGDEAIADLVAERFGEIRAGAVTEQAFEAELRGRGRHASQRRS